MRVAPRVVAIATYVVLVQLHTAMMNAYMKVIFNIIMYYVPAQSYRVTYWNAHATGDLSFRIYCQYYQYRAIPIYIVPL
jgi:hypothetical protein